MALLSQVLHMNAKEQEQAECGQALREDRETVTKV